MTTSEDLTVKSVQLRYKTELTCPGSHTVQLLQVRICLGPGLLSSHPLQLPLHCQTGPEDQRQSPNHETIKRVEDSHLIIWLHFTIETNILKFHFN